MPGKLINAITKTNLLSSLWYQGLNLVFCYSFEQVCVRSHSFPRSDCFKSLWIQLDFGNQRFPVPVSLLNNHAYEVTVSWARLPHSSCEISQIVEGSDPLAIAKLWNLWKLTLHNWDHIKDTIILYIVPGWRLLAHQHETLSIK